MKEKVKQRKLVSLLTILIMMAQVFMPLLNISYAAAYQKPTSPAFVFIRTSDIQDDGISKYFTVDIAQIGDWYCNTFDMKFEYDKTKIEPANKSTHKTATNIKTAMLENASFNVNYSSSTTYLDKTAGTIRLIPNMASADAENPEDYGPDQGYDAYMSIFTIYFRLVDTSLTEDDLTTDLFGFVPTAATDGFKFGYVLDDGGKLTPEYITDTSYVKFDNFAEPSKTVNSISVKTNPTNTTYNHGDVINLAGGEITVSYTDGTSEVVAMTDPKVSIISGSPANVTTPQVKISYGGKEAIFPITVNDPIQTLSVKTPMNKVEYNHGENFNFTGLQLEATKKSGAKEQLTSSSTGVTVSENSANIASSSFTQTSAEGVIPISGTQEITFGYQGVTAKQTVIVNDTISSVDLINQPTKTIYKRGENLNLAGAVVKVTLGSGNTTNINLPDGSVTVGSFSNTTTNLKQHLSVNFAGKTATQTIDVEVYNYVKSSAIQPPSNTNPKYNTDLNLTGGRLTLTWHDNTIRNVNLTDSSITISGYNKTKLGVQTVTVEYPITYTLSDGTTIPDKITQTFIAEVENSAKSISITPPTKTTYLYGNSLALAGGTITVTYEDNTTRNVTMTTSMIKEGGAAVNMSPEATAFGTSTTLAKTLTISYEEDGKTGTANYPITIINDVKSISMKQEPKTTYNVNDTLDLTNGEILVTRATGTPEAIELTDSRVKVTGFSSSQERTGLPLTVTFTENAIAKTTTYNIDIIDSVKSIRIVQTPKTDYRYNQNLDVSTGTIEIVKGSSTTTVPMTSDMVSGYDKQKLGNQTLTVTYGGKTAQYQVTVKDYVTGITVNPNTVTGSYNETLAKLINDNNITYTVTYAKAGAKTPIPLAESMVAGYSSTSITKQALTVTYNDLDTNSATNGSNFTATLNITLSDAVDTIAITAPTKDKYNYGESLNLAGGSITVTTVSGTTKNVPMTANMITEGGAAVNMRPDASAFGTNTTLAKTLTITYTEDGKTGTVNYPITIINNVKTVVMNQNPKTNYNVNEDLDLTNGSIIVTRETGLPEVVDLSDSRVSVTGFNSSQEKTGLSLTVTFTENDNSKTTSYNVNIKDTVKSIKIENQPKTNYKYNEELDVSTGTLEIERGSGKTSIPITSDMVSGYNKQTLGNQTLTITYGGETVQYQVTVKDYVTGITVIPSTVTGNYNETLAKLISDNNISYSVTYAKAGAKPPLTLAESMVDGYSSTSISAQNLIVTYLDSDIDSATNGENFTATLNITLSDKVDTITVVAPTKTKYNHGEALDLTGGSITVTSISGVSKTVPMTTSMFKENGAAVNMSPDATAFGTNTTLGKTITITYEEGEKIGTIDYPITIINNVKTIAMYQEPKINYNLNEPLDIKNGEILVTRAVGTPDVVPLSDNKITVTGFDSTAEHTELPLTVSFTENEITKTTTYKINVKDAVTGIVIKDMPNKIDYGYGETFAPEGGNITITRISGKTEEKPFNDTGVTITEVDGSPLDLSNVTLDANHQGTKTVQVSYEGQKATFTINITNKIAKIEMEKIPKTDYYIGDNLDLTTDGTTIGTIKLTRQNGETQSIPLNDAKVSVTGFDNTQENTSLELTVSYTENGITEDTSYTISVVDNVETVQIENTPKTNYKYGEPLDVSTGTLVISKGSQTQSIPMKDNMVTELDGTPFNSNLLGTRNLKITYGGQVMNYEITVTDYIKGILLVPPTKQKYEYGEALDLTGGSVQKVMASGASTTPVVLSDSSVQLSAYNPNELGAQTIEVTYEGFKEDFGVIVEDNIQTIGMNSTPKIQYQYGEQLDVTGGSIIATRSSGKTEIIPLTPSMVENFNPNQSGNQTLTVRYQGKTTQYMVNVEDKVIDINITKPTKLIYKIGESIDLTGGTVQAVMSSGTATTPVAMTDSNVTIQGFDTSSEGAKTIQVTYQGITKTFGITVVDELSSMIIKTLPNKLDYRYGENLDVTGGTIEIEKESGSKEIINMTRDMVSGYNPKTVGSQTLTVTYEGLTQQFIVNVEDYVSHLKVQAPSKGEYEYGEDLDLAGGKVLIIMASGKTEETAEMTASMTSGFNAKQTGQQTITVEYKGLQGKFTVNVVDKVKGISMNNEPNKTTYAYSENIDLTGATIKVVKSSGIVIIPVTQDMISGYNSQSPGTQVITVSYGGHTTNFVVKVNQKEETKQQPKEQPKTNTVTPTQKTNNITIIRERTVPVEKPVEEPKPTEQVQEPPVETPKKTETEKKPVQTLGVKDEPEPEEPIDKRVVAGSIAGLGLLLLLALLFLKKNVKIFVEEDGELAIAGLDKVTNKRLQLNIDKYLDGETYNNKVKVQLSKTISKKLDGKEIEIKHRNEIQKFKIEYKNEPYEINLD